MRLLDSCIWTFSLTSWTFVEFVIRQKLSMYAPSKKFALKGAYLAVPNLEKYYNFNKLKTKIYVRNKTHQI